MREFTIIFTSSWKFAATFPIAVYLMRMSFFETLLYTNIGGILGVIVFSVFSKGLLKMWNSCWPEQLKYSRKSKKIFSKKSRWLVTLKNKYGLPGIVFLTPVLLSIPVGAFLVTKYYRQKKTSYVWLITGQIAWSLIFTAIYIKIKMVI